LIVDANEAWDESTIEVNLAACRAADVKLIEQPLPAGRDALLGEITGAMRQGMLLCADESLHTAAELDTVAQRYQAINIKLDKTGGLTEALLLRKKARELGLKIMVGCMVGTSLAMAPALLLAGDAAFIDLDGPLLLAKDRVPGLIFNGSTIQGLQPELWG
jgi:L-alanine-DL-glutamate epimerase-like enolase superfamily enzyme